MSAWLALLSPVLALAGIYFGSRLTRNREADKAREDRITAAYAKLLDASAISSGPRGSRLMKLRMEGGILTPEDEAFADEVQAKFSNAHANILIYGSPEVIAALSTFYDHAPEGETPAARDAFLALISAMRRESDAEDYDAFDAQADNIMVSGPGRRTAAMVAKAGGAQGKPPGMSFGISYSTPGHDEAREPGKE